MLVVISQPDAFRFVRHVKAVEMFIRMLTNKDTTRSYDKQYSALIRDKISFAGNSSLARGGRSCSWALVTDSPLANY